MGTGLSCMKRTDERQAVHADGAAMPCQRCKDLMEGHVVDRARGIEAMATKKKRTNIQIIIILHDTDTTLIIPRPWRR